MNNLTKPFDKDTFLKGIVTLGLPEFFDADFCYDIYLLANEAIDMLNTTNVRIVTKDINQHVIVLYCAGEILYSIDNNPNNYPALKSEEVMNQISGK